MEPEERETISVRVGCIIGIQSKSLSWLYRNVFRITQHNDRCVVCFSVGFNAPVHPGSKVILKIIPPAPSESIPMPTPSIPYSGLPCVIRKLSFSAGGNSELWSNKLGCTFPYASTIFFLEAGLTIVLCQQEVVATNPLMSISLEYNNSLTIDCVSSGSASISVRMTTLFFCDSCPKGS